MPMTPDEIEMVMLRVLSIQGITDNRLARAQSFLITNLRQMAPPGERISQQQFMQAVWGAVSRGLAYIDFTQPAPENWTLELTERGKTALDEEQYIPDNVPAYLRKVGAEVPDLSQTAHLYLHESLSSYASGNFIAATMMIGVAAEAVFYEAANAFAAWTPDGSGQNLAALLEKTERSYIQKFIEFRKRVGPLQNQFPGDLQQNLDLNLNSVLELLRLGRNNVGHPTGIAISRDNAFQHIVLFPMLAKRLYAIRNFCHQPTQHFTN